MILKSTQRKYLSNVLLVVATVLPCFSSAAAPTGKYGCMFNRNFSGYEARIGLHATNVSSSILMYVNFDSPASISAVANNNNDFGDSSATGSQTLFNGTLSLSNVDTPITGSYQATISVGGTAQVVLNLLPVNGGNTLFATSAMGVSGLSTSNAMTGVCNKI
jgi:hypothetical protein